MQITYFILTIFSLVIISFDSSSNVQPKSFWLQLDRMKRSVAKLLSIKRPAYLSTAL